MVDNVIGAAECIDMMLMYLLQVLVYMSDIVMELEQVVQQDPNLTTAMPL